MEEKKTSLGIPENLTSVCAYALTFISGFIILILEKENKTVRFNAMQSFATFLLLTAVSFVLGFIPFIGGIGIRIVNIVSFVLWIWCMFKAFKGEMFKVPVIGDIVEKQINK